MKNLIQYTKIATIGVFALACGKESVKDTFTPDPHSNANPNEVVVTHLDLDLNVHFENNTLSGTATWTIENRKESDTIIFDTDDLTIISVLDQNEQKLDFHLGKVDPVLGTPLYVSINPNVSQVIIEYSTSPEAGALQWLSPEQTYGKQAPFLFTQSEAILARSWVPCQDSPGIRFTYNAKVQAPKGMLALMSATNPQEKFESGRYTFTMEQPIPAYLLALAVGDIEFKSLSPRSGVYAEPAQLDTAAWEFADIEKMIVAAEELYGPYAWGRYDLIVLPPSFPFGGMENPRLTFATPTILSGDRSLVSLVAHELAHSWSGNLVTNATWNDFWLNEGFTVYFELRIMESVYGRSYSEMLAKLSRTDLDAEIADMMKSHPNDTRLKLDLAGRNPDDGMTSIAYDKGYHLLRLIEETVGREKMDAFLKNYFQSHKFQVMDTEKFLALLNSELLTPEQSKAINIDEWVYQPGLPKNAPTAQSDLFDVAQNAALLYAQNGDLLPGEVTDHWTTHEWLHFLHSLPGNLTADDLAGLDTAYHFTSSNNSEILAAWFQPVIRAHYTSAYPAIEKFLIKVGRRKFLTPTYRAMKENGLEQLAIDIYVKARPNYHSVSRQTIDQLLQHKPMSPEA